MAKKISQLTEETSVASADLVAIAKSDGSATKKASVTNLVMVKNKAVEWIVDPAGNGDALTLNALMASVGTNDTVIIRPGTYTDVPTVGTSQNGATFIAYGAIWDLSGTGSAEVIPFGLVGSGGGDVQDVVIKGGKVIGTGNNTNKVFPMRLSYTSNCTVEDFEMVDCYAVYWSNTHRASWENCTAKDSYSHGLRLSDDANYCQISGGWIDGGTSNQGIYIFNNAGDNTHNRISNMEICNTSEAGIRNEANYTTVINVEAHDNGFHGIRHSNDRSEGHYCKTIGCTTYNNTTWHGIYIDGVDYNQVMGNHTYENGHNGVDMAGSYNVIAQNHCYNNSQNPGGSYYFGITLDGNASETSDNLLIDNVCFDNQTGSESQAYGINYDSTPINRNRIVGTKGFGNTLGLIKDFKDVGTGNVVIYGDNLYKTELDTEFFERRVDLDGDAIPDEINIATRTAILSDSSVAGGWARLDTTASASSAQFEWGGINNLLVPINGGVRLETAFKWAAGDETQSLSQWQVTYNATNRILLYTTNSGDVIVRVTVGGVNVVNNVDTGVDIAADDVTHTYSVRIDDNGDVEIYIDGNSEITSTGNTWSGVAGFYTGWYVDDNGNTLQNQFDVDYFRAQGWRA